MAHYIILGCGYFSISEAALSHRFLSCKRMLPSGLLFCSWDGKIESALKFYDRKDLRKTANKLLTRPKRPGITANIIKVEIITVNDEETH